MQKTITLNINSKDYTVEVSAEWTLLRVLRDVLHLTGTKSSCEEGDCGVCTVIIDGQAAKACITPAFQCVGKKIITIEGLQKGTELHFVQEAFMKAGAIQCGYCTPGMVMAITALYMNNPDPTEDDIKNAVSGNLCRCTGYKKIVDVANVIAEMRNAADAPKTVPESQIGVSRIRKDAYAKVTGKAVYGPDLYKEGMLYGAILRSRIPFGRLCSVDTSEAESLHGVAAVITAKDTAGARFGIEIQDQKAFADDYVRYVGEPIAAVAAESLETAMQALSLIKVDIEPLAANLDAFTSMKPDSLSIHPDAESYTRNLPLYKGTDTLPNNVCSHGTIRRGDADGKMQEADLVFEEDIDTHSTHQSYLEPHAAMAYLDENGGLVLHTTCQKPFAFRNLLADILKMPISQIRVIPTTVGGGFGGKLQMIPESYCCLLAKKTNRPVKIVTGREEEMLTGYPRHSIRFSMKTGVKKDGTIIARKIRVITDAGAYAIDSPTIVGLAMFMACGAYRCDDIEVEGFSIYTNKISCGSCRAPAAPQGVYACETHIDMIARALHMDPLEFRRKNILHEGDKLANGQALINVSLDQCLDKAAESIRWGEAEPGVGKGIACMIWMSGTFPTSALVGVNDDGSVQIMSGANEIGTGSINTGIPQIAAEILGVDFDDVDISGCDTKMQTYDHGVGASRMITSVGKVVATASLLLKEKLQNYLAEVYSCDPSDIVLKNSMVEIPNEAPLPLGKAAKMYKAKNGPLSAHAAQNAEFPEYDKSTVHGLPFPALPVPSFAAHGATVTVDKGVGRIRVKKVAAAHDVGRAINPAAVEGQIEGGVVMGLGYIMYEEMKQREGRTINHSFQTYITPTALDMPEIEPIIVEYAPIEDIGPMNTKGIGEPTVGGTPGAVANAVSDLTGIRPKKLPLNLENLYFQLSE